MEAGPTCKCGCGALTNAVRDNNKTLGLVKGTYHQFVSGHNRAKEKSTCSAEGCANVAVARKMCQTHYLRLKKHGDAEHVPHVLTVKEIIAANSTAQGECILWTGVIDAKGYGRTKCRSSKEKLAHRLSYESIHGAIPNGLMVCHKCDTPACIRPEHLFLGTHNDNMRDMREKGRSAHGVKNGSAVLTDDIVRSIKATLKDGVGCTEIARQFNVSHSLISMIGAGKRWGHVGV